MDSTGKITEPPRRPPQAASPALISAVLGNDDLLCEILLRLDFPTCLVRAAAVSKRWLRHASDPAFLRRFRSLHPPRLLGFYLYSSASDTRLRFIPLSLPPELAAVIRRGKFDLGRGAGRVSDCRNGRLIVYLPPHDRSAPSHNTVCRPLHPERGPSALPLPHIPRVDHGWDIVYPHKFMFHDDCGDDIAISAVTVVMLFERQIKVQYQEFQAGHWGNSRESNLIDMHGWWKRRRHSTLLANGKIYMICMARDILGLDVKSMSLFSVELPNGVEFGYEANIALFRAEGSGFCLIHVKGFQICVWRYIMGHSNTGNWELIDIISLCEVFGPDADPTWCSQGSDIQVDVIRVGENAEFMFFRIQKKVFYFHISSRTVEKVYELAQDESLYGVAPFMMIWPPTFPTLNVGHHKDG